MSNSTLVQDRNRLAEMIRERARSEERILIGIDGPTLSGKTTLAEFLQTRLAAALLSVDCYVDRHKRAYVKFVRSADLEHAIKESFDKTGVVIVEGVCLLDILERAHENIRAFHSKNLRESWEETCEDGTILGQRITPIDR